MENAQCFLPGFPHFFFALQPQQQGVVWRAVVVGRRSVADVMQIVVEAHIVPPLYKH